MRFGPGDTTAGADLGLSTVQEVCPTSISARSREYDSDGRAALSVTATTGVATGQGVSGDPGWPRFSRDISESIAASNSAALTFWEDCDKKWGSANESRVSQNGIQKPIKQLVQLLR